MDKKKVFGVIIFVFLISFGVSFLFFSKSSMGGFSLISSKLLEVTPTTEPEEPKTEECPINGQMMTKKQKDAWITRRPLGIMIENHLEARPQSGLSAADVVYEAVAEGGITRFLALYYCQDAANVGPVRSARVHFMKMLREYGDYPLYGHVGGANCDAETGSGCANGAKADALGIIRKLGWEAYNDMNQFGVPFPYFWRDYERLPNRATEHTVYTATAKLWDYAKTKRELTNVDEDGKKWDATFTSWKFQDGTPNSGGAQKISLGFWTAFASDFSVVWDYNSKTNSYMRTNGGKPHIDKNTGKQLEAKNIVILFAKESPANDGYDGGHILYQLSGTGDALIFQNGKAIKGTWSKEDEESRTILYDEKDKEVSIVRGKVFFEILPIGNKVDY